MTLETYGVMAGIVMAVIWGIAPIMIAIGLIGINDMTNEINRLKNDKCCHHTNKFRRFKGQ